MIVPLGCGHHRTCGDCYSPEVVADLRERLARAEAKVLPGDVAATLRHIAKNYACDDEQPSCDVALAFLNEHYGSVR